MMKKQVTYSFYGVNVLGMNEVRNYLNELIQ